VLPGTRSDGVVVLDLLATYFFPLRSLGVEVVHVESVVVSNYTGLSSGVKLSASELLDLLVL
jgi:pyridoxal/pyridoxine/pyridoxamine kinase